MKTLFQFLTASILILSLSEVSGQQANPNNIASVKGSLKDTAHNYHVKSATVSIYRSDSTLLNYQLSNTYGEFNFRNLPKNSNFYIEVSHISYQVLRKSFTTLNNATPLDLKTLILLPKEISLKEVAITLPPIQMNGDTLEFNAAAFKLDSNAVVEDLLRKIPNVTLWGDGQITVNGREVKSLLVNGKEFFGGDFKMALQNISKNALDKVQVYNQAKNESNPMDSSLTVNLKLKKSKGIGHFGKIGGGYGTTERFEADGNVNMYTPKLQLGIVAAGNNTNKIANSIRTLTANSTFKGTGISVDYQPDFRATGINRSNAAGATFSYNFIEKPTYENKKALTANYFVQNRNNDVVSSSQTATTVGSGNKVFDMTTSNNSSLSNNHNFDSRYEFSKMGKQLNISQNTSFNTGESFNNSFRSSENQQNELASTNNVIGRNNFTNRAFSLNADYRHNNYLSARKKLRAYNARYSLTLNDSENERTDLTEFISFVDASTNRNFNRRYNNEGNNINQKLFVELPSLKRVFFGNKRLADIDFGISNDFELGSSQSNNRISDFNNSTGTYEANTYLSNNLRTNTFTETPSLSLLRGFHKRLSNRFNRSLNFSVSAKQQFNVQDNQSAKSFQNIRRSYSNFVPAASASYYRYQYGEHSNNVSLNFNTLIRIPSVDQLAPLTDSTNVYRLIRGNINLREAKTRQVNLNFYHYDQRGKNTLNYNMTASVSFTDNAISDSIFIDQQNRRTVYLANVDGYRAAYVRGEVRKALKLKTSALQINLLGSANISKSPGYVNGVFAYSNNLNTTSDLTANYTYKGKLALEAKESYGYYRSRQDAFNTNYSGTNTTTTFSGSYNITKKFTLNSNISLNSNKPSGREAINYNIWNSSATYRFLKGDNVELKLTALDLLRQNNSIINSAGANSFTFATRNVLQQYFMTTFSYYPRKFGKTAAKK